jgi:hypothetical protein
MSYGYNASYQNPINQGPANAEPTNRPNTALEDIHKQLSQALSGAEAIAERLSAMAARLRGPFPPSGGTQAKPEMVVNGMIEELRQSAGRLISAHEAAGKLLEMIESAI